MRQCEVIAPPMAQASLAKWRSAVRPWRPEHIEAVRKTLPAALNHRTVENAALAE